MATSTTRRDRDGRRQAGGEPERVGEPPDHQVRHTTHGEPPRRQPVAMVIRQQPLEQRGGEHADPMGLSGKVGRRRPGRQPSTPRARA
jgi:hypothetical protein